MERKGSRVIGGKERGKGKRIKDRSKDKRRRGGSREDNGIDLRISRKG